MSPAKPPDIDPVLTDAVRRAYVRPVDEATAGRHVSAVVAAAAHPEPPQAAGRIAPSRRGRAWRPVLAAGAATLLLPVALAVAGVSLPEAIEEPFREVGITLPHQGHDSDRSPAPVAPAVTQTIRPPVAIPPAPSSPPRRGGAAKGRDPGSAKGRDHRAVPRRPGAAPAAPAPSSQRPSKPKPSGSSPRSGDKNPRRGQVKPRRGNQSRGGRKATPGSERAAPKGKSGQPKGSGNERPAAGPEARGPSAHSPQDAARTA